MGSKVTGHPGANWRVFVAEQVQVECKIERSGQVRWRAAGELGWVKGDEKLTAYFRGVLCSLCHVRPGQKTGFRYQNGCKLELNIFLLSQRKGCFQDYYLLFIFLTLWCVSSYILLVDKGLRYVTKWRPRWKWSRAGFTLNPTLSSVYLRWALVLEFSHVADDWNHHFVFANIWSSSVCCKKRREKDWKRTILPPSGWLR